MRRDTGRSTRPYPAASLAAALVSSTIVRGRRLGTAARVAALAASIVLGAFAIAGARSQTVPAAAGETRGAPPARGPSRSSGADAGYDLP